MSIPDQIIFDQLFKGLQAQQIKKESKEGYAAFDSKWLVSAAPQSSFGATASIPVPIDVDNDPSQETPNKVRSWSSKLISLILAVTAAYLAWNSDFSSGGDQVIKVIQTAIAALLGSWYIIFFVLFLWIPSTSR